MKSVFILKLLGNGVVFFLLLSTFLYGQNIDDYEPLKAKAPIPEEFRSITKKEVEKDIEKYKKKHGDISDEVEQFLVESNYYLKKLLHSGKILFNDPLTNYVQKIADYIYEQNSQLSKAKPKIYLVKSPYVNAFTLHDNKIFMNVGLVAQVENEAELAYIIAHEIVHYVENHALERHKESERIKTGKKDYENVSTSYETMLAENNYTRTHERIADTKGLELFDNTKYAKGSVFGAFDVLQYAYLPFKNIPYDQTFLETNYLKFPDEYFLNKTNPIKAGDKAENDQLSTHPNVQKRKRSIEKEIGTADLSEGKEFIISEKSFKEVQRLARFEVCRLHLQKRNYPKAIYCAYSLLEEYPNHAYLKRVINKALYNLAIYKNNDEDVMDVHHGIEGESQQVYYFLNKLSAAELNVVAVNYAWNLKLEYPENTFLDTLANSILKELIYSHDLSLKNFYKSPRGQVLAEKKEELRQKEELSKYDKIEKQQLKDSSNFKEFAFVGLIKNDEFHNTFQKYLEQYEREELITSTEKAREDLRELLEKDEQSLKKLKNKKVERLVALQPSYSIFKTQTYSQKDFIKSESRQIWFSKAQQEMGEVAGLEMFNLNPMSFKKDEIEKYNHLSLIQEWLDERSEHEDLPRAIVSNQNYINDILEKRNTRYYLWTVINNLKTDNTRGGFYWILTGVGLPIGLYEIAKPNNQSHYITFVFDLKEGDIEWLKYQRFSKVDGKDYLQSFSYNTLSQIKRKSD